MGIAAQFNALVQATHDGRLYYSKAKDETYGASYVFDGYMDCHVVVKDGLFYDVQDSDDPMLDLPHMIKNLTPHPTLERLVERMLHQLEHGGRQ